MKVCLISASAFSPSVFTGMEIYMRNLPQKLAQRGHQVVIITTSPDSTRRASLQEKDGVKIYSFYPLNIYERSEYGQKPLILKFLWHGLDLLWNPHSYTVIKGILRKEMPDVVQIHNYRGLSPSVFSAVKSLHIPLIFTVHDYSLVCPKSTWLRSSGKICGHKPLVCNLYKTLKGLSIRGNPDLVTADTYFVLDKMKEFGFFRKIRTEKLPTTPIETGKGQIARDFDNGNILFVGNLNKVKGAHILITAFKGLQSKNINLHIAGSGVDEEQFKKMASDDQRIIFHGLVPWEKLTELYQKASVTVVPSLFYEPLGFVILESFRSGTPVIASRIGGIPELVKDGYNGKLFEPGNADELKNILKKLLVNPSELQRLGKNAFESAMEYSLDNHILKLEKLYEQLVK